MSTLKIKDLHVSVETQDGPKEILKGVNLTIESGEIHAIMEGGTFFERILSDTIPRSNTDEIKGKTYIHPLFD